MTEIHEGDRVRFRRINRFECVRARIRRHFDQFGNDVVFAQYFDVIIDALVLDGDEKNLHRAGRAAFTLDMLNDLVTEGAFVERERHERFRFIPDNLSNALGWRFLDLDRPDDGGLSRNRDGDFLRLAEFIASDKFFQRRGNGLLGKNIGVFSGGRRDDSPVDLLDFRSIRLAADLNELDRAGPEVNRELAEFSHGVLCGD